MESCRLRAIDPQDAHRCLQPDGFDIPSLKLTRSALIILSALLISACSEDVRTTHANRQEALDGGLVAQGWLPAFVPVSAEQIQTSNNLDLNTSEGSFKFKAQDWSSFAVHLKPQGHSTPPFADWARTAEKYKVSGYEAWWYEEQQTTWVFFCKPREGVCEHLMWKRRHLEGATP